MIAIEREIVVPVARPRTNVLACLDEAVKEQVLHDERVIRFVVTESDEDSYRCELGTLQGVAPPITCEASAFAFRRRRAENADQFTVVMLVPTGIGAEIGGHAGDATPAARLLAGACDRIVLHPNVVNASDINELPSNALYVEGSVITRFLMGTVALEPVRSNRILLAVDPTDSLFVMGAIHALSGARAAMGLRSAGIVSIPPGFTMRGEYATSGRAVGHIDGIEDLCGVLDQQYGKYDAVAIASYVKVPTRLSMDYFASGGTIINPWGGAEAILTHAISMLYEIPSAHAPLPVINDIIAGQLPSGMVDPRMAAESASLVHLHCVLKGLHQSPRIVSLESKSGGALTVEDVSCLVIPDKCLGLPTFAALEQGIPVIAVRENNNIMRNDLGRLPWAKGQFYSVDNYTEAAGVVLAIRHGIAVDSVRRPLAATEVEEAVLSSTNSRHSVISAMIR